MSVKELSHGAAGTWNTEVRASNIVLIRRSESSSVSNSVATQVKGDRFTPGSSGSNAQDGVQDTISLTSTSQTAEPLSRSAMVATVIAAVEDGTYQVDSSAVARSLVSKMTQGSFEDAEG